MDIFGIALFIFILVALVSSVLNYFISPREDYGNVRDLENYLDKNSLTVYEVTYKSFLTLNQVTIYASEIKVTGECTVFKTTTTYPNRRSSIKIFSTDCITEIKKVRECVSV